MPSLGNQVKSYLYLFSRYLTTFTSVYQVFNTNTNTNTYTTTTSECVHTLRIPTQSPILPISTHQQLQLYIPIFMDIYTISTEFIYMAIQAIPYQATIENWI